MPQMHIEVQPIRSILANYVEVRINGADPCYVLSGTSNSIDIPEGHCTAVFISSFKKSTIEFDADSDISVTVSWTIMGAPKATWKKV